MRTPRTEFPAALLCWKLRTFGIREKLLYRGMMDLLKTIQTKYSLLVAQGISALRKKPTSIELKRRKRLPK
jgi:hypothetical protein